MLVEVGKRTCDEVPDGPESGGLDGRLPIRQQIHEGFHTPAVQNSLDLMVVRIHIVAEVAETPAGVGEDLAILVGEELPEDRERRPDEFELGLRLPTTEVAQGPDRIPKLEGVGFLRAERE